MSGKRVTSFDPLRSILILYRILIVSMYCVLIQMYCNGGKRVCNLSAIFVTYLACTGSAAAAESSGGQRWPGGAGCWDGKPGSSRRACSPAGTRQDKCTLHTSSLPHLAETQTFCTVTCERYSRADLDLLLEQVDLVLLLDQLLLLLGDLRHTRYVQSHTHLTRMWRTDSVVSGLHSGTQPTNCKSLQNIWILNIHLNIYDISFTVCCTVCCNMYNNSMVQLLGQKSVMWNL